MSPLGRIKHALAAASATTDPAARAVYIATAKALVVGVDEQVTRLKKIIAAKEAEMVRERGVQLEIGGSQ